MDLDSLAREQYVYLAKLAEQSERYEEMGSFMEQLVVSGGAAPGELTVEERNLFSVAYRTWWPRAARPGASSRPSS